MFFYFFLAVELLSVIIGFVYYPYLKKSFMRWVLPFLIFIFFSEIVARVVGGYTNNNLKIYCFISIAESLFYGYFFYNATKIIQFRKLILILTFLSVLGFVSSLIILHKNIHFLYLNFVITGFFLSFMALGYIYIRFLDDQNFYLITDPVFWVALGVSLFYSGTSVVFIMHDLIRVKRLWFMGLSLHNVVPQFLSVLLYLSISIAIIQCKKKTRISL